MGPSSETRTTKYAQCVELAVVGAGPHALSLMTKILEPRVDPLEEVPCNTSLFKVNGSLVKARFEGEGPARLVSSKDSDLRRFEHDSRANAKGRASILNRCFVADPSGCWMRQWEHQFSALGIPMLRSPITAHPDPIDGDMLRKFADETKRRGADAIEVDLSRTEQYHGPFEAPSTSLFNAFCHSVVARYGLEGRVHGARVSRLVPIPPPLLIDLDGADRQGELSPSCNCGDWRCRDDKPWFELHLDDGTLVLAKNVVVATGSLGRPALPAWAIKARDIYSEFQEAAQTLLHSNDIIARPDEAASTCSICSTSSSLASGQHQAEIKAAVTLPGLHFNPGGNDVLLVVGGGLTAGHLALRALRSHPNVRVVIASRRPIFQRQFDLDLKWMGLQRKTYISRFWSCESMAERRAILKESKNGGSMTPEVLCDLRKYEACGRLEFLQSAEVIGAHWECDTCNWLVSFDVGDERIFNAIWCATGTITDFGTEKLFDDLRQYSAARGENIRVEGGIPCLTEDLRLAENLNVFIMGNAAALRVGPGALNLMGGKAAAGRIAEALHLGLRDSENKWTARDKRQGRRRCSRTLRKIQIRG
ncbi:hypothetical protein CYMTET_17533 [Cymbomonas tetramitiformis]|uniref:L-ornithine N(5)-oxygenase n=1 Tax=Cymbomonas tetramitiformis TaxID=36881 RepID=A0AAE0L784_9CHLO|nr:hypothetical protein CYMTET_17533 [Cymbomonas tetramitiformis]|eukprot:gene15122-17884_t